ncbi:head maturation protease, ClpP-related [Actinacidiphila rubida]|uniref:ATP-dependent Clp protease proteolytic subunit n=1 Tax=Actinacidiphila rubida TaxID=310780 RepID=A0A1H8SYW2_9ACTN|nr:head maturation protease, ClpP-related [Actinacidiphila rubida]SEO83393.1 ATP-dependent protease ClpP, protease subunit [Actinacidiphila rubida]
MAWMNIPEAPAAAARRAAQAQAGAQAAQAPRWYTINNAADPEEAEVLLYDAVGGWFGIYADEFLDDLRQITAPKMRLRINSPGGSVFEGIAIANALRAHPATVTVQVDGIAASIASVIAMAGDRIEMAPNSMLMIHEASGVCMGDAAEMAKMAEVLDLISKNIANAYAARAGSDAAGWRAAMQAETWYLPDAAVAAGLADVALSAVPESPNEPADPEEEDEDESELMEARLHASFDLAAFGYAGPPKAQRPKPGPPPAAEPAAATAEPTTLTIRLGDAVGEDLVATLRRAIAKDSSPQPSGTGPQGEDEAAGTDASPEAPEPAAADDEPAEDPAAADPWAEHIARLTTPQPDPWAADIARLTGPASSRATES